MKRTIYLLLLFLLLFCCKSAFSQNENLRNSEKPIIPFMNYLHIKEGFSALSSLAFVNHSFVSLSAENRFLLKEMMTKEITSAFIFKGNVFKISTSHFGYSKFGELTTRLGYAKLFGNRFSTAVQFYHIFEHAFQYENEHSFSFDISFGLKINQKTYITVLILNPVKIRRGLSKQSPILPMLLHANIAYLMNKNLLFYGSIEKEMNSCLRGELGVGYQFLKQAAFAVVLYLPSSEISAIFRLSFTKINLEIANSYNFKTGFSPSLSLIIPFIL